MKYLLDTNILLRLIEVRHPQHKETIEALKILRQQDCEFYILLQNVSEFWNVCTRSVERNGLGLSIQLTDFYLARLERFFTLLPDIEDTYRNWRELVVNRAVSGAKVHDAKIVASMKAHNIQHLLTFNSDDFKRYSEISVVEPTDIRADAR